MTIKDYCLQISKLLEEADHEKSKAFIQLGNLYVINREEALSNIKNIYGGMGSFNDFVLFKDEKVDVEANEKLSALREDLYKAVVSEIIELRS
ncbi:DUF6966 domain-containing protein [Chryseobacterium nepalense]|uniref:DUF6966 domain-containing protein n=1 Tax=Chryseobacterium nepalense TaxID=1854498 RepID=A0ABY4K862_9FLAO|nr:hypothetical protein [Chryseobacterium nepalense]UPQ76970.1 hypothetical protein M0D58_05305 [Chryseobacterium nepalense]